MKLLANSQNVRFTVPLTAMFKRSSSAPAPRARVSASDLPLAAFPRRDSFSAVPLYSRAAPFGRTGGIAGTTALEKALAREGTGHAAALGLPSAQMFNGGAGADGGVGTHEHDVSAP